MEFGTSEREIFIEAAPEVGRAQRAAQSREPHTRVSQHLRGI